MKSRIDVPHLGSRTPPCWPTCRASPWCPPRCPPCRSAGRRARPQVWHINPAFHTWPGSFGAGPRSLGCNLTIFCLSETSWLRRRSGGSWQDPERKKNWFNSMTSPIGHIVTYLEEESASEHQEGPLGPPSKSPFFTISQGKITKNVGSWAVGTHHSYEVGTGFNMFLYHQSLFPKSFTLTPQLFLFSKNFH